MPYFRTTIKPGHEVRSYLQTLQGQGHLDLSEDGAIQYTIEAEDMWDLANALRDVVDEADANAGRHRGDSEYDKPREVPSWNSRVVEARDLRLPNGLPTTRSVHNAPNPQANGSFIPAVTVAYILEQYGLVVAEPGE